MWREGDQSHTRVSVSRGSLSGELLDKLSAIVRPRRTSQIENNCDIPILDHTDHDDVSLSDCEGTPSSSSKTFGFMRRFSRATTYTTEDSGGAPLRRMLEYCTETERQRRFDLEMMNFSLLHEHFQPLSEQIPDTEDTNCVDDNQVEEELHRAMENSGGEDEGFILRRKSRETTTDAEEYALQQATLQRLESMESSSSSMDDDAEDDDADESDDSGRNESDDELNFDDPVRMGASVRKLVRQIEDASFQDTRPESAIASGVSGVSNQDDEDRTPVYQPTEETRHSDPLANDKPLRRTTYPVNTFRPPPPTQPFLPQSCYIPMDEVQEDLTKSVRRLVIGLKEVAEAQEAQPSGIPFVRRRGNSCPAPYCPPTPPTKNPSPANSPPPTQAAISMNTGSTEPPRWRKRSTLARLAPRFLETFRRKRQSYLYTDEELESIEGARWKIVELAFRFGGKHRAYLVQAVNMFFPLIKYGRHGGPHPTRLHCNRCGTLQWQHKRGGLSEAVDLADVLQVIEGRQTAVFRKYVSCPELDSRSLSLVFKERTLDLETQSSSHRDWLMSALRTLVAYAKRQRQAETRAIAERALLPLEDMSEGSSSLSRSRLELLTRMGSSNGSNVGALVLS